MFANISSLDIATGLKELLINHNFTLDALLKVSPAELAIILGIDLYVARLIYMAAKRRTDNEKIQYAINQEELISGIKVA